MITIELVLVIAVVSMSLNVMSWWAIGRMRDDQINVIKRAWARLNYLEVGMSYHGLIPLPLELEEMSQQPNERNTFKQEGNVVYLQKEE